MTNQPITPPPGLVQEWIDEPQYMTEDQLGKRMYMISLNEVKFREIISKASQYGADRELEACCEWLKVQETQSAKWFDIRHDACALVSDLRAARRPKPPSLKEQALDELHISFDRGYLKEGAADTIRHALEALPE